MNTQNETSSLMKSVVAALHKKRKAQIDMAPAAPVDETNLELPEERHEIDIMFDIKKCIERVEDEEVRSELSGLADELAAIHGIDKDVESIEDLEVSDTEAPAEMPTGTPPALDENDDEE